jgi:hypothetical protein
VVTIDDDKTVNMLFSTLIGERILRTCASRESFRTFYLEQESGQAIHITNCPKTHSFRGKQLHAAVERRAARFGVSDSICRLEALDGLHSKLI